MFWFFPFVTANEKVKWNFFNNFNSFNNLFNRDYCHKKGREGIYKTSKDSIL